MKFYEKHADLMNEVVEFARSGPLLAPADNLSVIRITFDFGQAKDFCWHAVYGNEEYTWTDLREREMSKVNGIGHKLDGYAEAKHELDKYLDPILNYISDRIDEKYRDVVDDIAADLSNCLISRAVQGTVVGFFERMLEAHTGMGFGPAVGTETILRGD